MAHITELSVFRVSVFQIVNDALHLQNGSALAAERCRFNYRRILLLHLLRRRPLEEQERRRRSGEPAWQFPLSIYNSPIAVPPLRLQFADPVTALRLPTAAVPPQCRDDPVTALRHCDPVTALRRLLTSATVIWPLPAPSKSQGRYRRQAHRSSTTRHSPAVGNASEQDHQPCRASYDRHDARSYGESDGRGCYLC